MGGGRNGGSGGERGREGRRVIESETEGPEGGREREGVRGMDGLSLPVCVSTTKISNSDFHLGFSESETTDDFIRPGTNCSDKTN